MKVRELIEELKRQDPAADVVALGHRDFLYPVMSIQKLILIPTPVYEVHLKLADAFRDSMKSGDDGVPCVELVIA
jgi:hypothetical protein